MNAFIQQRQINLFKSHSKSFDIYNVTKVSNLKYIQIQAFECSIPQKIRIKFHFKIYF